MTACIPTVVDLMNGTTEFGALFDADTGLPVRAATEEERDEALEQRECFGDTDIEVERRRFTWRGDAPAT